MKEELTSSVVCYGCDREAIELTYCEGCGNKYCRNCYILHHWCGTLTTIDGIAIKVGDYLRFADRPKYVYEVLEIPRLYRLGGACLGKEITRKNQPEVPLRPRLMELVK